MIKNCVRTYTNSFKETEKRVANYGYTLYKNNDSRGKYYIAKSGDQYIGGNNTPVFFNTIGEIQDNWLFQRDICK